MAQMKHQLNGARGVGDHPALRFLRNHAATGVTMLLFAAGSAALWRLLSHLNVVDVIAQAHSIGVWSLAAALLATVIGYAALIGYDASALRYLGKHLPRRQIGLGGFLGYSIGNTVGLSVVSGAAVRYRIYARFGLDAIDVMKIATFAALSYGLGATVIGLAALALQPEAIVGLIALPVSTIRLGSLAAFLALAGGLWALSHGGRSRTIWRWTIRAPAPALMLRQVILTGVELAMGACVLFVLLPSGHGPFLGLVVLYAIATLIGILSHVPGGVGVFETIMLAGLPATLSAPQVLAPLLLFRIIYFLLPFCIALAVFGISEIMAHRRASEDCKTVTLPTGNLASAPSSWKDKAAILLPMQEKDEDMKSIKMATLGAALLVGTGAVSAAFADTEKNDTAELQQFLGSSQSLTQAISAAETAVGGKAMDAGWDTEGATGGAYHVEVVKADGTLVDVIVSADGSTQVKAEQNDGAEGEDQDGDGDNG